MVSRSCTRLSQPLMLVSVVSLLLLAVNVSGVVRVLHVKVSHTLGERVVGVDE